MSPRSALGSPRPRSGALAPGRGVSLAVRLGLRLLGARLLLAAGLVLGAGLLLLLAGGSGPASAQEGEVAPVTSPSETEGPAKLPTSAIPGGGQRAAATPPSLGELLSARALRSVVKVYGAGGFTGVPAYGSGVVIDERGFVLTAWSIALDTPELHVVTPSGKRLPATLWAADAGLGAALLRVDPLGAGLVPLRLSPSGALRSGAAVLAIGNPFGIVYGAEPLSVQRGVVTVLGEPREGGARVLRLPGGLSEVILTDIPNNPGTQGGALLTLEGELVGILGRLVESRSTNTVLNFALPADALTPFVQASLAQAQARPAAKAAPLERVTRSGPDLGIRLQRAHLVRSPLAYVEIVRRGSPAAAAGVKPDDLVFRVGARTIRDCRDYDEALSELADLQPGARIPLTLKRGAACLRVEVEVPQPSGAGQ